MRPVVLEAEAAPRQQRAARAQHRLCGVRLQLPQSCRREEHDGRYGPVRRRHVQLRKRKQLCEVRLQLRVVLRRSKGGEAGRELQHLRLAAQPGRPPCAWAEAEDVDASPRAAGVDDDARTRGCSEERAESVPRRERQVEAQTSCGPEPWSPTLPSLAAEAGHAQPSCACLPLSGAQGCSHHAASSSVCDSYGEHARGSEYCQERSPKQGGSSEGDLRGTHTNKQLQGIFVRYTLTPPLRAPLSDLVAGSVRRHAYVRPPCRCCRTIAAAAAAAAAAPCRADRTSCSRTGQR